MRAYYGSPEVFLVRTILVNCAKIDYYPISEESYNPWIKEKNLIKKELVPG